MAAFQDDACKTRSENSNWKDGVFESHLGTILKPEENEDSSDDEETVCTECTQEKVEEYVARLNEDLTEGSLDDDPLLCYGLCWIRHVLMFPRTPRILKSMCRSTIRKSIGGVKMVEKIGCLGLPVAMQDYLLFRQMY